MLSGNPTRPPRLSEPYMMMFYTYVLESKGDRSWYVGQTMNLKERFNRHQHGYVPATARKRPWKLIYYEACLDEQDAIAREKYYKTGFGRKTLRRRLANYLKNG